MSARSFTLPFNGISNVLTSICIVRPAFNPSRYPNPSMFPQGKKFVALWDTGATNSVITKKVADELGLQIVSYATVNHAGGKSSDVPVYRVNIELPNNVGFVAIPVSEGILAGADVLIGMDIINQGDFAVSNFNGHTTFSFRVPSTEEADLSPRPTQPIVKTKEPGRNDPCPCGSGKKYKQCHGKNRV